MNFELCKIMEAKIPGRLGLLQNFITVAVGCMHRPIWLGGK